MPKKQYFREPTLANILKESEPLYVSKPTEISEKALEIKDGQYLILKFENGLIPQQFSSARKFLKHGNFIQIPTPSSIDEAVEGHMYPWILRRDSFDSIDKVDYSGYSFRPFASFQDDKRERRVRLVELCEALRILSYAENPETKTTITINKVYAESERVSKDGATVDVSVPSRSKKQPRYGFNMYSIVVDSNNPNSYAVANGFFTDIKIPINDWSFRYNYYQDKKDSNVINIYAPEIAAYFKFMLEQLHQSVKPNKSATEMSPFGIPTNLTVDYYKNLLSKVVIYDPKLKNKLRLRKLNKAEQEIMLWALVKEAKHEKTFFRRKKRDGPIENLDWKILRGP